MILTGDSLSILRTLPDESVQTCVTSPPYWSLRDYGVTPQAWGGDTGHRHVWGAQVVKHATNHTDKRRWAHGTNGRGEEQPAEKRPGWKRQFVGQGNFCKCGAWRGALGLEPTPELFVAHLVEVFREVKRVLKADGTAWINLGDSYATGAGKANVPGGGYRGAHDPDPKLGKWAGPYCQPNRMPIDGLKPKDLVGMPWRVAFALQSDGWYLRSDIIWHKANPMPESVTDRPTKAHEYLFLLTKSARYFYDAAAIKEPTSPDTHARYSRGRSKTHKYADGGPGHQTIAATFEHMRVGREGKNSRMHVDRDPAHLKYGSGNKVRKVADGSDGRLATNLGRNVPWTDDGQGRNKRDVWTEEAWKRGPGVNPKCAEPGRGIKQNSSFCAVVKDVVDSRNKRTVWKVASSPFKGAHFATFPAKLIEPCILAGSQVGDVVLDPFSGAGTTGLVAQEHGREYLGIELNPEYVAMAEARLAKASETIKRHRAA